ncbi:MAG TPA: hypothetical protein VMB21_11590 [Candidatus Limnocylindria bacterium]|jgi:hypothetical protein|nr:hypothetical protein [Candidatus Limnocylindria bacterium]
MKTPHLKIAATLAALSLFSLSAVSALAETGTNGISTNTPAIKHAKPKAQPTDEKADGSAAVAKHYPFRGTVASVDKKALTITLQGKEKARVITVGSQSLFVKDAKPATFSQVAVGDYARGTLEKDGEHEVLVRGIFGPAPEKKTGDAKPAKKDKAAAPKPATAPAPAAETK